MGLIDKYIFRQTLIACLFSGLAVCLVILFSQSFRLLTFVINNSGGIVIFFKLMGLMVPTFLPIIIPLSLGVGTTFVYHKFATESELAIMRTSGLSPLRLATPAVWLATFALILTYAFTLYLTPLANRGLVDLQYEVRDNYSIFLVKPGVFNDITEGLTFFVRAKDSKGALKDILIHDVRKPAAPVTIMADSGLFTTNNGNPKVTVFKGKRQEIDPATGHMSQLNFDSYVLDLNLLSSDKSDRPVDLRERTFDELFLPSNKLTSKRNKPENYISEIHQRLSLPLGVLGFTFIGLASILAGEFNRRGMMKRIIAAAFAIILLQAALLTLSNAASKNLALIPLLYLVPLIPVPVGLWILLKPPACKIPSVPPAATPPAATPPITTPPTTNSPITTPPAAKKQPQPQKTESFGTKLPIKNRHRLQACSLWHEPAS